jgi:Xaa-Pro aminopeptidase
MTKRQEDAIGDLKGLERAIAKSDFDAVIAVSPENVRYAGDVSISTQVSIRDRLAFIVWPKGRDPIFLVCLIEAAYVKKNTWIQDVRTYQEFTLDPITALAGILRELKLENGHVAVETEYIAAKYYNDLTRQLPKLKISPAEPLFARVRMMKTPREREIIIGAFHGTERAFLATYSSVCIGETEKTLANRLAENILIQGADMVAFNHLNAGANTGFPHMSPSEYRVRKGDIVKADSGGFFKEYYSNVGRTAKVGKPTPDDISYWKKLRDIHHAVIEMCRPGKTGRELFDTAKRMQEKAGLAFAYSHNGHSIGLNVHERPIVGPHEDLVYEPGMITTVETRARWVGELGYHMEDIIEITESGPIWHAKYFQNEELFII